MTLPVMYRGAFEASSKIAPSRSGLGVDAALRDALGQAFARRGGPEGVIHFRVDIAGRQRVDRMFGGELQRHRLGRLEDAAFDIA